MGDVDIDKIAEIHRQIDAVLLKEWDPIGVRNEPYAQREYRRYVRGVYDVAVSTRSARRVAEYLVNIEGDNMGMSGMPGWQARMPVAEKILGLVADVGPLP